MLCISSNTFDELGRETITLTLKMDKVEAEEIEELLGKHRVARVIHNNIAAVKGRYYYTSSREII